jgi:hypothetical protein
MAVKDWLRYMRTTQEKRRFVADAVEGVKLRARRNATNLVDALRSAEALAVKLLDPIDHGIHPLDDVFAVGFSRYDALVDYGRAARASGW